MSRKQVARKTPPEKHERSDNHLNEDESLWIKDGSNCSTMKRWNNLNFPFIYRHSGLWWTWKRNERTVHFSCSVARPCSWASTLTERRGPSMGLLFQATIFLKTTKTMDTRAMRATVPSTRRVRQRPSLTTSRLRAALVATFGSSENSTMKKENPRGPN